LQIIKLSPNGGVSRRLRKGCSELSVANEDNNPVAGASG